MTGAEIYYIVGGSVGVIAIGAAVAKVSMMVRGKMDTDKAFEKFQEIKVCDQIVKRIEERFDGVERDLDKVQESQTQTLDGIRQLLQRADGGRRKP